MNFVIDFIIPMIFVFVLIFVLPLIIIKWAEELFEGRHK